jgi:hypothetical protein
MANRYDNGSVAKFNPFTYQELAVTPMMQRQKHDQLLAQQELLRQGLAKTNPHEKYFDEAVRLKDELNNQITSQADLLAKEGVNPNSQADFVKLNRNYQETMSPTGKLGMINAHNVNLQSTYKNYIEEAIKAGQSPAIAKLHADQSIKKHMQEPLYDERGRVVDFSAGNAAPKYIDNVKWINDLATKVGFTQDNWANASSGISKTADGRFVVNSSAKGMTKDNIENLNRLAQAANREVSDPASEIRQNIDYNFKNPQTELEGMLNQLYARRERESGVTDMNKSYGSVDWNKIDESVNPNLNPVNVEAINITSNSDLLSKLKNDISLKSTNVTGSPSLMGTAGDNKVSTKKQIINSPEYKQLANNLVFSNKNLQGKRYDSPEIQKAVQDYLEKNSNIVMQNRFVDPNTDKTGLLFADKSIPKDKDKASKLISEYAQQGSYEVRDINGNVIPTDELGKYKFTYSGDMTAKSKIGKNGKGIFPKPEQNVGARRGLLYDPETKKSTKVYVSRSSEDFKTPQFKAMKAINDITSITDGRPNVYNDIQHPIFDNYGMKNVKVKYNSKDDSYELKYTNQDGIPTTTSPISSELFQKNILDDYNQLQ